MRYMLSLILTGFLASNACAQGFDSTSDGSDGALTFGAGAGVIIWDPATAGPGGTPLDADGDNIFHFTTITIPVGTTVKLIASNFGGEGRPVTWLASGDVVIEGVIDLDGAQGHLDTGPNLPSEPGAGGWSGGAVVSGVRQPGSGPGGGVFQPQNAGGGGTHRTQGYRDAFAPARAPYGNRYILPLLGGSGGGAGTLIGGGAGAGALLVASSTSIVLEGEIHAIGGAAATYPGSGEVSSGGSGGAIRLVAPTVSGSGSCDVNGGAGSIASSPTSYRGGSGWIRIQAFTNGFLSTGTVAPAAAATFASPGLLFPPGNTATLRVTSIDGIVAPDLPTGSFNPVDVTIDNPGDVTIAVSATNIPVGTTVSVVIASEDGALQFLSTTPLAGSRAESTATVSATLPTGYSRISIAASWTP